jgi:HlyD family secretion protein
MKKDIKNKEAKNSQKNDKNENSDSQIFNKTSLERAASPEHLDKMIKVTDSKGWLALCAALSLVFVVLVWSFIGSIPTKVRANGVLIKSGGIKKIQHISGGIVTDVSVKPGDIVERGDVIARLGSSDIITSISNARFELKVLEENNARYIDYHKKNIDIKREYFKNSKASLNEILSDLNREIKNAQQKYEAQKELFKKGGISREEMNLSAQRIDSLEAQRDAQENNVKQLLLEELSFDKQQKDMITNLNNSIFEKREQIKYLQDKLDSLSKIISPYKGRIIVTNIEKGDVVAAGQSLATIELDGKFVKNLEAALFVPVSMAKNIAVGMEVQISPSTVNSSEYGVLLGRVTKVEEYPASFAHISDLLGDELAATYSRIPDPIEIIVDIVPANTPTGFKWTSKKGPDFPISSGTIATAEIKIKDQKPISVVFPGLSKMLD